jgi:hypothetical protein
LQKTFFNVFKPSFSRIANTLRTNLPLRFAGLEMISLRSKCLILTVMELFFTTSGLKEKEDSKEARAYCRKETTGQA